MVVLDIVAEIKPNKSIEFNQSKLNFFNELQNFEGYIGFKEKSGSPFSIHISWKNQKSLDRFIKSEHYRVFHGAIITLSNSNKIEIIKSKQIELPTEN